MKSAERIKGKLPPSPKHPKGRNPYAHIATVIKSLYGCSYKELPDRELSNVLSIIEYSEVNPF